MKNLKKKLSIALILSFSMCNFSTKTFSAEGGTHPNEKRPIDSNIGGQMHGKILAPQGADLSSVIIQVIGANQFDRFIYYTVPNKTGEFNFDGILPSGSLVQLYIWDGNGILNSTVISAYVSKKHSKETGLYEVVMQDMQYTQNIAQIYHTTQDLTSTGLCGKVGRYKRADDPGIDISVFDRFAKKSGPLYEQKIDSMDRFCFFNLNSISGTDMYDFVIRGPEGDTKTFSFYLPPSTFVHNAFLDSKASLYKPIKPYFWKENLFSQQNTPWEKLNAVNISTSDDYSFVSYDETHSEENLFYFPLSNELLEVSYFLNGENSEHLFLLLPRTKLFRESKPNSLQMYITNKDCVYVDYSHPLPLKFVTENELAKFNPNYYSQTWNERFGSAFVNIDLTQFGIKNTNEVKFSLRNLAGQEVGTFEELITIQNEHLIGYFFNLFPGRYQLFLTNLKNELIWTYEVRSYPNRVQILTTDWDQLKIDPIDPLGFTNHLPKQDKSSMLPITNEMFGNNEIIEESVNSISVEALQNEKVFLQNNLLYQSKAENFCNKSSSPGFLDKLWSQKLA